MKKTFMLLLCVMCLLAGCNNTNTPAGPSHGKKTVTIGMPKSSKSSF